jgi:hypothetical protein
VQPPAGVPPAQNQQAKTRGVLRAILDWLWRHLVPRRVRRFLSARFFGIEPPEIWGYVLWGSMGVVVATPELAAAVGGNGFPWRTISTTTGHLEDLWPTVAIAPVGLIAILAYGAFRFPYKATNNAEDVQPYFKGDAPRGADGMPTEYVGVTRNVYGRPIRGELDLQTGAVEGQRGVLPIKWYFPTVAVGVAVASYIASRQHSPWTLEYVMYGLIAVFWILIPIGLSYLRHTDLPFYNLFFTLQALDKRLHLVGYAIAGGVGILFIHLALYPWPDFAHTPSVYAGLSPAHAQELAEKKVAQVRHGLDRLTVLTGDRIVTNKHEEAWIFYFATSEKSPSDCTVLVQGGAATPTSCDLGP